MDDQTVPVIRNRSDPEEVTNRLSRYQACPGQPGQRWPCELCRLDQRPQRAIARAAALRRATLWHASVMQLQSANAMRATMQCARRRQKSILLTGILELQRLLDAHGGRNSCSVRAQKQSKSSRWRNVRELTTDTSRTLFTAALSGSGLHWR